MINDRALKDADTMNLNESSDYRICENLSFVLMAVFLKCFQLSYISFLTSVQTVSSFSGPVWPRGAPRGPGGASRGPGFVFLSLRPRLAAFMAVIRHPASGSDGCPNWESGAGEEKRHGVQQGARERKSFNGWKERRGSVSCSNWSPRPSLKLLSPSCRVQKLL